MTGLQKKCRLFLCACMEINNHRIIVAGSFTFITPKTTLMLSPALINKAIILGFMVMVGYSIAKSIQNGSLTGLILAIVSLCAGIYFLYLLAQAKEQAEREDTV